MESTKNPFSKPYSVLEKVPSIIWGALKSANSLFKEAAKLKLCNEVVNPFSCLIMFTASHKAATFIPSVQCST